MHSKDFTTGVHELSSETESPAQSTGPSHGQPIQQKIEAAAETARQTGAEAARRTAEQGRAFLEEQQQQACEVMHDCSEAIHLAAQNLREKQDNHLASMADTLADRIEDSSNYFRNRSLQGMREDVEGFARRQPALFYGGLVVIGLGLSRFFKASQERPGSSAVQPGGPQI
jgi:hypothetical protein